MLDSKKDVPGPVGVWAGDGTPQPLMPYTPAIKAGGWIFLSGQLATDYKQAVAPEATPKNPNTENALELQSRYVMKNLAAVVKAAGRDMGKDSLRIWQWFTSPYPSNEELEAGDTFPKISITPYLDTRNEFIFEPRPASTGMGTKELLAPDTLLEVDLIVADDDGVSEGFEVPEGLPSPLAGYSPAIKRGDWVFLAGEIPVDWKGDWGATENWGEPSSLAREARINPFVWYGSAVEQQTDYTLWKLSKIAEAAGTSLKNAVKADVYIGHPKDYEAMERAWKRWFPEDPPARCVIPYMGLGGKGSRVEISFTLLAGDSKLTKETIYTDKAPKPFSHEPQAVKAGPFLFFSQQLPCDENGVLAPGMKRDPNFPYYGEPARLQMRYMLKNIAAICEAGGTSLENVVRRACFHDYGENFAQAIDEWAAHFPGLKPCSTTMNLHGEMVVPGAHTLLDIIAYVPES